METYIEKVLKTVEGLISRSIGPSVTLLVLVGFVDLLVAEFLTGSSAADCLRAGLELLESGLDGTGNISFAGVATLFTVMSFGLAMVQQVAFDQLATN